MKTPFNRNITPPSPSVRKLAPAQTPEVSRYLTSEDAQPASIRFIGKAKVLEMVGKTYPTVWKWMNEGTFPRARNTGGSCSWIEADVLEWMANRPIQPLKSDFETLRPLRQRPSQAHPSRRGRVEG